MTRVKCFGSGELTAAETGPTTSDQGMLVSKDSGEYEVANKVGGNAKEVSDGEEGAVVIPEVPVFPRSTSLGQRMIFLSALPA